jgi:hypothetical protein
MLMIYCFMGLDGVLFIETLFDEGKN